MYLLLHDYGGYPFTKQLAIKLSKKGYQVDYLYSTTTQLVQRANSSNEQSPDLKIVGIELETKFEKYNYLKRRKAEIEHGKKVADYIRVNKPDIVICANTPLDSLKYIFKSSKKVKADFIFWLQDAIGEATQKALSKKLSVVGNIIGKYYQNIEKKVAQKSDQIILISKDFISLMQSWHINQNKLHVIPNWAPVDQFNFIDRKNDWSVEQQLDSTFNFMYTGILGLKHDPEIFIKLAMYFQKDPEVRIVVISKGPVLDWLKEQKEGLKLDNLLLLDFQPANVYSKVLASADVLISVLNQDASTYSVPSKILSYLSASRPILLSVDKKNFAAKIIEESNSGLVSNPSEIDNFLNNAKYLYQNPDEGNKMRTSARVFAEKNFDIGKISDQFIEIINR